MTRRIKASTSSHPVDREALRLVARAERELIKALGVYSKFSSSRPNPSVRRRSDEAAKAIREAVARLGTIRGMDPLYDGSDPDLAPERGKEGSGYERAKKRAARAKKRARGSE
jgi:hypothetical protein